MSIKVPHFHVFVRSNVYVLFIFVCHTHASTAEVIVTCGMWGIGNSTFMPCYQPTLTSIYN